MKSCGECNISKETSYFSKRSNWCKDCSVIDMLKYSSDGLKVHIESLFKDCENCGEWHIGHRIPVSKFDPNTPIDVVNSLDSLQPLWSFENLSKSNKI